MTLCSCILGAGRGCTRSRNQKRWNEMETRGEQMLALRKRLEASQPFCGALFVLFLCGPVGGRCVAIGCRRYPVRVPSLTIWGASRHRTKCCSASRSSHTGLLATYSQLGRGHQSRVTWRRICAMGGPRNSSFSARLLGSCGPLDSAFDAETLRDARCSRQEPEPAIVGLVLLSDAQPARSSSREARSRIELGWKAAVAHRTIDS